MGICTREHITNSQKGRNFFWFFFISFLDFSNSAVLLLLLLLLFYFVCFIIIWSCISFNVGRFVGCFAVDTLLLLLLLLIAIAFCVREKFLLISNFNSTIRAVSFDYCNRSAFIFIVFCWLSVFFSLFLYFYLIRFALIWCVSCVDCIFFFLLPSSNRKSVFRISCENWEIHFIWENNTHRRDRVETLCMHKNEKELDLVSFTFIFSYFMRDLRKFHVIYCFELPWTDRKGKSVSYIMIMYTQTRLTPMDPQMECCSWSRDFNRLHTHGKCIESWFGLKSIESFRSPMFASS